MSSEVCRRCEGAGTVNYSLIPNDDGRERCHVCGGTGREERIDTAALAQHVLHELKRKLGPRHVVAWTAAALWSINHGADGITINISDLRELDTGQSLSEYARVVAERVAGE